MKKSELTRMLAGAVIAGAVLVGCSSTDSDATTEEAPVEETAEAETEVSSEETEGAEEFNVEESAAATQLQAYKAITEELAKASEGQEVDWELASTTYTNDLQSAVNTVSGDLDQMIQAAIEGGKNGEIEGIIAKQLVDKTTQSYFYQVQKGLQKETATALEEGNADAAKEAFEQIKYLSTELFIPTAVKRDGYYELSGGASLEENINAGLAAQEEALNAGNTDEFKVFVQLTDKSIYRSYYLASNSYAEKIATAVEEGKEELDLQNMQAEAFGFYQAIKGSLSGGDEEAATKLDTIFALDQTNAVDIDPEEVSSLFVKAIVGKVSGYHEKAPVSLEEGNVTDARVQSLEGNMFLKMIEIELVKALGEEKAAETFENAEAWFKAISEENAEEAKTLSEAVLAVVNEL
ncbi:hypothetical protein [Halalkalibacter urbisdiaboli]|uniref:hypothetical protein n=1 Tax=Halalkalibacter urbisdiaboli TaxID=1960589 RepID=UPI000B43490F|nr:hypothetical protein [Halalkalibacter urbisdiaboli]